jgi:hypothetical protein
MKKRRFWEIGAFIAAGLLILFGAVATVMGINGYNTTRDAIKDEGITFGTTDDPAVAKYASQWAGDQVTNGDQARVREGHAHAHAGGHRRVDVRGDGPLPVRSEAERSRR